MIDRNRRERLGSAIAFALYVLLTTSLVAFHEPWRDEADAWLIAKHASLRQVFELAGHSGTPCLWYLVQMPFAKAGMAYRAQSVINLVLVTGAAALLLFRAPLPWWMKAAYLFGFHMSFEYPVVARNYGLGVLLLFAAVALDGERRRHPLVYGVLLAALANTSAHFLFVAAVLGALWAWDLRRSKPFATPAVLAGLTLAVLGGALAIAQMLPRPGGQFPTTLFMVFVPRRLLGPVRSFFPDGASIAWAPLALVAYASTALYLAYRPRAFTFAMASWAALTYIFVFKYAGGDRHYGLLLVVLVAALWLAESSAEPGGDGLARLLRLRPEWLPRIRQIAFTSVAAGAAVSMLHSARNIWPREFREHFSEAEAMARYLAAGNLAARPIAAHPADASEAVLAYLGERTFYYPAIDAFGTHMWWDAKYEAGRSVRAEEAVARVQRRFPNWASDGTLVLLNTKLEAPARLGLALRHQTPGRPWRVHDESYFLYEPSSATQPSPAP